MAEQVTRSLNMAGTWWLPDKYEGKMLGTLKWLPHRGCELTLVSESHKYKWDSSPGIILGLNSEQDPVTLVGCRHGGHPGIRMIGNVTSYSHGLTVNSALIGHLFENESDIVLMDLYAGFAGMDEYIIESYFDYEHTPDAEGRHRIDSVTFVPPKYERAKIGETEVGLYVGFSIANDLQLQHKLHISFPESNSYSSEGTNYELVHRILPSFLSALMEHQTFITSLDFYSDHANVEIFDGYHSRMSWDRI